MKGFMKYLVLYLVIAHLILITVAYSQSNEAEMAGTHKNEHSIHWNHIAVFGGATSKFEKEGTHFSIGMDYLRKFPAKGNLAISLFAEAIFEEHIEWLFGIPVIYWVSDNLWIRTGPGIEILQEEKHDHAETKTETKTEFLWRAGVGYDIEFGKYNLAPSIDIDFERSTTALVWGLNFGYGF